MKKKKLVINQIIYKINKGRFDISHHIECYSKLKVRPFDNFNKLKEALSVFISDYKTSEIPEKQYFFRIIECVANDYLIEIIDEV